MRKACDGDKSAFVEIVARYQAMVCGVAFGILNDFAASEDAGQEVFITAWKKLSSLRDLDRLRPWLAQIARNSALGHLRKRHPHEPLENEPGLEDTAAGPDQAAVTEEESALVRDSLARIPENYRLPLVLFYRDGQSVRGVAETLEISEDAVKQRLARGREMLRDRMSGILEGAIHRTGPSPIFTMSVAIAIGAMAAPAAMAASVFTTASTGTATAATPVLTIMSTSKSLLIASVLAAVVCVPVGYKWGADRGAKAHLKQPKQSLTNGVSNPQIAELSFEKSTLFAEWRKLHEIYGTTPEAMPALYQAIARLPDKGRRRAFHAALVAEWVQLDSAGGLRYYLAGKISAEQRQQFFEEWLAQNPHAAVAALLQSKGDWNELARSTLKEIAKLDPGSLSAIVLRLPASSHRWDTSVQEAFSIVAGSNLSGARAGAETLTGLNRDQAMAGIAQAWAKNDLEGALAWIKQLPEGSDRNELFRACLIGRAASHPGDALDRVGAVPAGGREGYFASTTGARVLKEAGQADFEGTVAWLAAHPGKIRSEDMVGLAEAVTDRLNNSAAEFLSQRAADGSLGVILPAIDSALLNGSAGQRNTIWEWLEAQPESEASRKLKSIVLRTSAWQDPDLALRLAADSPKTPEGDAEVQSTARDVFNGGSRFYRFETLMESAPERLRGPLLQAAFDALPGNAIEDPQRWISRVSMLPENARAKALESVGRAWAERSPEEAVVWAGTLADPATKEAVTSSVLTAWAKNDPQAAGGWINSTAPGPDRDAAALTLVYAIAQERTNEAWQWTVGIDDQQSRTQAVYFTIQIMATKDPALAQRSIATGLFTDQLKEEMAKQVAKIALNFNPLHR